MNANDRSITGFVMVAHGLVHTYELSVPILMTVWLLEFSVTAAVLGAVVTVGYGLFGVGALPGGLLVDRYGSRRLIVGCLFGMGVAFLSLSLVPHVATIALALGIWGAAASVYHPAGLALISNGIDPDTRGTVFAYHGMAGNAGIAFGPLATALLLLVADWRIVVVVLGGLSVVAGIVGLSIDFDETAGLTGSMGTDPGADGGNDAIDSDDVASASTGVDDEKAEIRSLGDLIDGTRRVFTLGFSLVFLVVMFNGLFYRGMLTFLPELLNDFLVAIVGDVRPGVFDPDGALAEEFDLSRYVYVGLLTVGIVGQYVGGRLTDRIEPERGLVVMLLVLSAITLAFVPASRAGLVPLLAIGAALGFALFAMQPLTQATIAAYSPPESRGLSFGFTYLGIFGIGALGATVVGVVLTYAASEFTVFLVLAGFTLTACTLATVLVSRDLRP
ncbi:MFS transporter [Halopenitus sp. H-Gu1]|uniref:MFS transporter n=1 Tax=Halopenitus sp. H-Gu1 TaxID=3242697 RepID=UPI00359EAE4E